MCVSWLPWEMDTAESMPWMGVGHCAGAYASARALMPMSASIQNSNLLCPCVITIKTYLEAYLSNQQTPKQEQSKVLIRCLPWQRLFIFNTHTAGMGSSDNTLNYRRKIALNRKLRTAGVRNAAGWSQKVGLTALTNQLTSTSCLNNTLPWCGAINIF